MNSDETERCPTCGTLCEPVNRRALPDREALIAAVRDVPQIGCFGQPLLEYPSRVADRILALLSGESEARDE